MQLHSAAARGDLEGIRLALAQGASIDTRDDSRSTALLLSLEQAVASGRRRGPRTTVDAVRLLLAAGASLDAVDLVGASAIHLAARTGDIGLFRALLEAGANPKSTTKAGYSVLLHACFQIPSSGKIPILEQLLRLGANPDQVSDHGESPLGVSLQLGDFAAMRLLLSRGASPDVLQWTPLHLAVAFGTLDEVRALATSPETINAIGNPRKLSPWLLGFLKGDLAKTQFLAERGADLTQTDRCGETPLHLAAQCGHTDLVSWWLDFGADVHAAEGPHQHTALDRAVENNHLEAARALLAGGATAGWNPNRDHQPIHLAHSVEMIRVLVESGGADVNSIDGCGDWPLKSAAEANDVDRISWLTEHGAGFDLTSTGETALHAAVRSDAREAVSLLLERGANPNTRDVDGWTPLFEAKSSEAIHALLNAGADPDLKDQADFKVERWLKDPILLRALRRK